MAGVSEGNDLGSLGLSTDQLQGLLNLLNNQKISNSNPEKMTGKQVSWIIDTRASDHMTGILNNLHNLRDIVPRIVGLPNGNTTVAIKEGALSLDRGITLENVLYVSGLTCNLISMSQFIDHLNCIVIFTRNMCVMQDHTLRMLISAREHRDGLFFFMETPCILALKIYRVESSDL